MRSSFTDVFIKHPVLAAVVNLVIVLVGWRALTGLPVQQYPQIESSSVQITTVYYGASAETVRGFLTTPIERAVSAISGVDYLESTSRAGVSIVTIRLVLNHDSTAALAEVTARLQQDRGRAVLAGVRHARIEQQLVPRDPHDATVTGDRPYQRAGELVRARRLERVGVVDADEDHSSSSPRCGRAVARKNTAALISPAASPHAA